MQVKARVEAILRRTPGSCDFSRDNHATSEGTLLRPPSVMLSEARGDQVGDGRQRAFRVRPGYLDQNGRAFAGCQHHQTHDRGAWRRLAITADGDGGVEAVGAFDELADALACNPRLLTMVRLHRSTLSGSGLDIDLTAYFEEGRLATFMYFRPASCAAWTAVSRLASRRMLASLTSMGRLTPARTSIRPRSMTEMARLEVPPNMSVNTTTPSPLSTMDRLDDLLAALGNVIVGADGNCLNLVLGADHVLQGGSQLVGQTPMRHEHDTNHQSNSVLRIGPQAASPKVRHIVQADGRAQLGASTYPLPSTSQALIKGLQRKG